MFDIAVILINYNSSAHSINCIRSIIEHSPKSLHYQIIITDNCSQKEDYLKLKDFCDRFSSDKIQLHRSKINSGFGGGNMHGVQYANAHYYAFINNDTLFLNDCLSTLKNVLDLDASIAVAGGQSFKENGEFMTSFDHFSSPLKEIFGRSFLERINPKRFPKRKKLYTEPMKVNLVQGSFMFTRAKDFNEIGGFDTNIFLYYEETDLCHRLAKKSKQTILVPAAQFIHLHGASTEKSLAIKKELKISLLYVIRKHYGFFGHKLVLFHQIIKYFFSSIVKPNNWPLFMLLLSGAPMSKSLKLRQQIIE